MAEFKDKIPTGGGKVEYLYYPDGRRATQISGFMRAVYMVAVSMDGRHLLGTIPATGIGHVAVYPQPSVTAYIQSDEQCMWGRNCPFCHKYFRTNHIMDGHALSLLFGSGAEPCVHHKQPIDLHNRLLRYVRTVIHREQEYIRRRG